MTPRARILICPGGGYRQLVLDKEGTEIAAWLEGLDYEAVVLKHRLPGVDGQPFDIALADGLAALDGLGDDLPVFVMGLSSGGHLAGVLACHRPVAGLLALYAPLNANHRDYKAPAGKPDYPPAEKQAFYDAWPIGLSDKPHGVPKCPVFLAYALGDASVPIEHALNFIRTARDISLDLDAHIFGQAPHGFALRDTSGRHAVWPELAAKWLESTLSREERGEG